MLSGKASAAPTCPALPKAELVLGRGSLAVAVGKDHAGEAVGGGSCSALRACADSGGFLPFELKEQELQADPGGEGVLPGHAPASLLHAVWGPAAGLEQDRQHHGRHHQHQLPADRPPQDQGEEETSRWVKCWEGEQDILGEGRRGPAAQCQDSLPKKGPVLAWKHPLLR